MLVIQRLVDQKLNEYVLVCGNIYQHFNASINNTKY